MNHVLASFEVQEGSLFSSPAFESLCRVFEAMIRNPAIGAVYCILDGLDECDEASLLVLLTKFRVLFSVGVNSLAFYFKLIWD